MREILPMMLICYLIGSVPTAIWTAKLLRGIDIRDHGSGNAGATNSFRVLGWKAGVFVLVVDMAKGWIACLLVAPVFGLASSTSMVYWMILAGLSAIVGHVWTIFAGFRGGKGVGTAAGMFLAIFPVEAAICFAVFMAVLLITGYSSMGSLAAAVALPLTLLAGKWLWHHPLPPEILGLSLLLTTFVFFTHRSNIRDLLRGDERRLIPKRGKAV